MKHPLPALALIATFAVSPAVAAEGPYPVWLSPSLGIERVEDVPAMLDQRFPLESWEDPLLIEGPPGLEPRNLRNCNELINALDDGYWLKLPDHWRIHDCRILAWLTKATAAKVSHVRDFKLDASAPNLLPAAFVMPVNCDMTARVYQADRKSQSWSEFSREFWSNDEGYPVPIGNDGAEVLLRPGEFHAVVETSKLLRQEGGTHFLTGKPLPLGPERADLYGLHVSQSAEIVARADLNDDGIEDMLIRTFMRLTDGRLNWVEILAITRHEPDAVLRLLDPVKYVARVCDKDLWQYDESFEGLPLTYPPQPWRP